MLTVESISLAEILELKTYQQPAAASYAEVKIIRGRLFYARFVRGRLQEYEILDSHEDIVQKFQYLCEAEEKLGSKLL